MTENYEEVQETYVKIIARCHCEVCNGRFLQEIKIHPEAEQGNASITSCKVCKENETVSLLVFDRIF